MSGKKLRSVLSIFLVLFAAILNIPFHTTDAELVKYEDQFKRIVFLYCREDQLDIPWQTSIQFVPKFTNKDDPAQIGVCKTYFNKWKIEINKEYWDSVDDSEKMSLMFHELSHCYLGAEHVDIPDHYMYPTASPISRIDVILQTYEVARGKCKL